MAQRGRKPKPTAVKMLEGNPGKRGLMPGSRSRRRRPQVPGVAGSGGEEGMEADGAAWDSDGD